jgi:hypothetical protein
MPLPSLSRVRHDDVGPRFDDRGHGHALDFRAADDFEPAQRMQVVDDPFPDQRRVFDDEYPHG